MPFTITNTSLTQSTLTQTGTDTSWVGMDLATIAIAVVARNDVYAVGSYVRLNVANGFLYRCTTAGTTAATEPAFSTSPGISTTDGTAVFFAFTAPTSSVTGAVRTYFNPTFNVVINGTLTIANPAFETVVCRTFATGVAANYTSGRFCLDGVTPKTDGVHFTTALKGSNDFSEVSTWAGTWNIRGGTIQLAASVRPDSTLPQIFTAVTFVSSAVWARSIRFRAYSTALEFRNECRFYDIAYDAFRIPPVLSVKGFASEYVSEYVGSVVGGGNDSKMTVFSLSNQDGYSFDFDNYGGGWVEIYNCAKGAGLDVRSLNNSVKHCVPLFQQLNFKVINLSGVTKDGVKFICTDAPTNSPTALITTASNLKTWDFRTELSYSGTTAGGGLASSVPVLKVWHGATNIQNLRFPASTAVYRFCGYDVMQQDVSVVLGADAPQNVAVAMTAATNLTMTEAQAGAITGISVLPSMIIGPLDGYVTISAPRTLAELWHYFRAWKPNNLSTKDSWTYDGVTLNIGKWKVFGVHNLSGGTLVAIAAVATGPMANLSLVSEVFQDLPTSLTNVTITGSLTYNTATTTQVTFTNSNLGLVSNTGTGVVTVKRINSTVTPGTNVVAYLPTTLVYTLNGGRVRVLNHVGVEQYNQTADGSFELPVSATGIWSYKIAKYGAKVIEGTFTINGTTIGITPAYIPDPAVVDTLANVNSYVELNTSQKIYDYYSNYLASALGIVESKVLFVTPSGLTLGGYNLDDQPVSVTSLTISIGTSTIAGINVITTGLVTNIVPSYPQQITSVEGTTNWLRITPTFGQVYTDNVTQAVLTTASTALLAADFSDPNITIYVTQRGFRKQVVNFPRTTALLPAQSFVLIPDTNVVDITTDWTFANLTTAQEIYDAFAQYQASATGLLDGYSPLKIPGGIDFGKKGLSVLAANNLTGNTLNIKTTGLISDSYYSQGVIVFGSGSVANPVVLRFANLDSEIVFTPNSITFYPNKTARDTGSSRGLTVTGGIYRFLHGATVAGVVMSGTVNVRVTVGAVVFFLDVALVAGANILDLGIQGQLSAIVGKLEAVPTLVWAEPLDSTMPAKKLLTTAAAALAGKATGGGTETITLRNLSDTADAVTMTVDVNGNRSAVTLLP